MIRVVVGILKKANKVLVAERPPNKPYSGYWEFPGGKIEAHESALQALKRELAEELGITVLSAEAWFQYTHDYPDKTVLLHLYLVTDFSGEPQGKENQLLKWATLSDMLSLRLLEGNLPIMDRIKNLFAVDH